jgi:hypothetical protein
VVKDAESTTAPAAARDAHYHRVPECQRKGDRAISLVRANRRLEYIYPPAPSPSSTCAFYAALDPLLRPVSRCSRTIALDAPLSLILQWTCRSRGQLLRVAPNLRIG